MDAHFPHKPTLDDTRPVAPLVWDHRRKPKPLSLSSGYTPPKPSQKINPGWIWAALGLTTLIVSSHIRGIVIAVQIGCASIGCICVLAVIFLALLFGMFALPR